MFEYFGYIHVYSPGTGADIPLDQKYFHKHKSSVHLVIPSKFSDIKFSYFSQSNAWVTKVDLVVKKVKVISGS